MGYRNYLGSLPKKEYNRIKNFTLSELFVYNDFKWSDNPEERDDYLDGSNICNKVCFSLGKYVDNFDEGFFKNVFKNEETQKYFDVDGELYLVNKEFLLYLIEHYTQKVREFYDKMLNNFFDGHKPKAKFLISKENNITEEEMSSIYELITHVRDVAFEWGVKGSLIRDIKPYNLDSNNDSLVSSWMYEYTIFELVRIYKSFNWKQNVMIYYGR